MNINEFEKQLMNLAPVEPALDPAGAAYEAGFRRGRSNARIWQISSGCMTILVVMLGVLNFADTSVQPQQNMASSNIQLAMENHTEVIFDKNKFELNNIDRPAKDLDINSYLLLRRRVLDEGLDVLPKSSGRKSKAYSLKDILNS